MSTHLKVLTNILPHNCELVIKQDLTILIVVWNKSLFFILMKKYTKIVKMVYKML